MTAIFQNYIDLWESEQLTINKSSEVDGINVLARVKGRAFFPNTASGNNVFYPLAAWQNALSEPSFLDKLKRRLVYGTIGHGIVLDDNTIRKGEFSHILIDIYINEEGVGIAEYLILNTPPGRILNTLLRAGSKLRVSTKCRGLFESRKNSDGCKVIDKDNFIFERIDFVLEPGFVNAQPEILESLNRFKSDGEKTSKSEKISMLTNISEELKMALSEKDKKELAEYRRLGSQKQLKNILEALDKTDASNLLRIHHNIVPGSEKERVLMSLTKGKVKTSTMGSILEALDKGDEEEEITVDVNPEEGEEYDDEGNLIKREVNEEDPKEYEDEEPEVEVEVEPEVEYDARGYPRKREVNEEEEEVVEPMDSPEDEEEVEIDGIDKPTSSAKSKVNESKNSKKGVSTKNFKSVNENKQSVQNNNRFGGASLCRKLFNK